MKVESRKFDVVYWFSRFVNGRANLNNWGRISLQPILTVGSVAFDSVKTPFGDVSQMVGGAATYFSVAASFFTNVRVVAVVGDDDDASPSD